MYYLDPDDYNSYYPNHHRRRDNISNNYRTHYYGDGCDDEHGKYYNDDADSYEYTLGKHAVATREALFTALWAIYCIAGGDPDGCNRFHCSDRDAIRATIKQVDSLRQYYEGSA